MAALTRHAMASPRAPWPGARFAARPVEDGRYLAGVLAFYLSNRSRAVWQSKPSADVNINVSPEQLVLGAIKLRESEKADPKLIEHQTKDKSVSYSDGSWRHKTLTPDRTAILTDCP